MTATARPSVRPPPSAGVGTPSSVAERRHQAQEHDPRLRAHGRSPSERSVGTAGPGRGRGPSRGGACPGTSPGGPRRAACPPRWAPLPWGVRDPDALVLLLLLALMACGGSSGAEEPDVALLAERALSADVDARDDGRGGARPARRLLRGLPRRLVGVPRGPGAAVVDVVADHGADPTGRTDATAAFQAALDHASPGASSCTCPAGLFRVDGLLAVTRSGVVLRGEGAVREPDPLHAPRRHDREEPPHLPRRTRRRAPRSRSPSTGRPGPTRCP